MICLKDQTPTARHQPRTGLPSDTTNARATDWVEFIFDLLKIEDLKGYYITEGLNELKVFFSFPKHYINGSFSLQKDQLNSLEFGGYLQNGHLGPTINKSLIKGVLIHKPENDHILFTQRLVNGQFYKIKPMPFNDLNQERIRRFLSVPLYRGWVECYYRWNFITWFKFSAQSLPTKKFPIRSFPYLKPQAQFDGSLVRRLGRWIIFQWRNAPWHGSLKTIRIPMGPIVE